MRKFGREWLTLAEQRLARAKAAKLDTRNPCPGGCGKLVTKHKETNIYCSTRCRARFNKTRLTFARIEEKESGPKYPVIKPVPDEVSHL